MSKPPLIYLIALFLAGCSFSHSNTPESKTELRSSKPARSSLNDNSCDSASVSKGPVNGRSVIVYKDDGTVFRMSIGQLNRVLLSFPELNDIANLLPPDETYAKRGLQANVAPCNGDTYNCEVCRDNYYTLYAYFLKQRNGDKQFAGKRDTLINLYRKLNEIERTLKGGGTFFGHQYSRIPAYAEYSLYLLKGSSDTERTYDIKQQKRLYLLLLKQRIADEIDSNDELMAKERLTSKKKLDAIVNEVGGLITDRFFLERAQQFQCSLL